MVYRGYFTLQPVKKIAKEHADLKKVKKEKKVKKIKRIKKVRVVNL